MPGIFNNLSEVKMELPIIFPFTYLSGSTLELVHDALGRFEILQLSPGLVPDPVAEASQKERIVLRFPQGVDSGHLERLLEDYLNWAGQFGQDGRTMALYYQQRQGLPPLVDENSPSRIRSQVKKMAREEAGPAAGADPFLRACLILAMAQYYDQQQDEVGGRLQAIAGMERELYAGLKGEDDPALAGFSAQEAEEDPGAVKTSARLVAWALLAASSGRMPAFWVTTSRAVIEYMVEKAGLEFVRSARPDKGFDPADLDKPESDPGGESGAPVMDLERIGAPALVLFRLNRPQQNFPFSVLESELPRDGVPENIVLGWLKL